MTGSDSVCTVYSHFAGDAVPREGGVRFDDPAVTPWVHCNKTLEYMLTRLQGMVASEPACLQPEDRVLNAIDPWIPGAGAFILALRRISSQISR